MVGPRLAVVEHALEVLQRERNLQWPKLFVLAEAASQGRPYPILDRPDDKTGRCATTQAPLAFTSLP